MGAVAEGCVCGHFAVAELVVTRLRHIESYRTASSDNPLALTVAEGVHLRVTATTPVVALATIQIDVSGEDTSVRRHAWGTVFSLFVGA